MAPQRGPSSFFSKEQMEKHKRWLEPELEHVSASLPVRQKTAITKIAPQASQVAHPQPPSYTSAATSAPTSALVSTPSIESEKTREQAESNQDAMSPTTDHVRKLVTVRRVDDMTDVDDYHVCVKINGWNVVVRDDPMITKGRYVVFFEPDSFLPVNSEFAVFWNKVGPLVTFNGKQGYRVGTEVWTDHDGNQVISQGLVLPLFKFPPIDEKIRRLHFRYLDEGDEFFIELIHKIDFSPELGVIKWEAPAYEAHAKDVPKDKGEECVHDKPAASAGPSAPVNAASSGLPLATANKSEEKRAAMGQQKTWKSTSRGKLPPPPPNTNPGVPSWIKKSKMERVQNCPNLFVKDKYKWFQFQVTIKLDGVDVTCYFVPCSNPLYADLPELPALDDSNKDTFLKYALHPNGRFGVCTSNYDLLPHKLPHPGLPLYNILWETAVAEGYHTALAAECASRGNGSGAIAVHAELIGPEVQRNPYNMDSGAPHTLHVFSIDDVAGHGRKVYKSGGNSMNLMRRNPKGVEEFAERHHLRHVEVRGYHTVRELAHCHEDLIRMAEESGHEGLVFKCLNDGRWFKVLSTKWLLEKGDEKRARELQEVEIKPPSVPVRSARPNGKSKRPTQAARRNEQPTASWKNTRIPATNDYTPQGWKPEASAWESTSEQPTQEQIPTTGNTAMNDAGQTVDKPPEVQDEVRFEENITIDQLQHTAAERITEEPVTEQPLKQESTALNGSHDELDIAQPAIRQPAVDQPASELATTSQCAPEQSSIQQPIPAEQPSSPETSIHGSIGQNTSEHNSIDSDDTDATCVNDIATDSHDDSDPYCIDLWNNPDLPRLTRPSGVGWVLRMSPEQQEELCAAKQYLLEVAKSDPVLGGLWKQFLVGEKFLNCFFTVARCVQRAWRAEQREREGWTQQQQQCGDPEWLRWPPERIRRSRDAAGHKLTSERPVADNVQAEAERQTQTAEGSSAQKPATSGTANNAEGKGTQKPVTVVNGGRNREGAANNGKKPTVTGTSSGRYHPGIFKGRYDALKDWLYAS